jgi:hypothetical protein
MGVQGIVSDGIWLQLAPVFPGVLDVFGMGSWAVWSQGVAPHRTTQVAKRRSRCLLLWYR